MALLSSLLETSYARKGKAKNCHSIFGLLDDKPRIQRSGKFIPRYGERIISDLPSKASLLALIPWEWGGFDKWVFPIVAHMGQMDMLDQLVAVQPMAAPPGQVLYMDLVYGPGPRGDHILE